MPSGIFIVAADEFFNRWNKKNQEARQNHEQQQAALPAAAAVAPAVDPYEGRLPTLDDVAQITTEADFSPFMKQGVDEVVKRSALKKLFADPRFNVMDGLDIYIGDYTQSDPIPPEMMAMLEHARDLLNPPVLNGKVLMGMQESDPVAQTGTEQGAAEADASMAQPAEDEMPAQASGGEVPDPHAAGAEDAAVGTEQAADADLFPAVLPRAGEPAAVALQAARQSEAGGDDQAKRGTRTEAQIEAQRTAQSTVVMPEQRRQENHRQ